MSLSKIRKDMSSRELYFFGSPGFFHSMPTSLVALLVFLRSLIRLRVDLQLENLALRHLTGMLQRSLKKRPKITAMDRLLWTSLSRIAGNGRGLASQGLSLVLDCGPSIGATATYKTGGLPRAA